MKKAVTLLNVLFVFLGVGLAQTRPASQTTQQNPAPTQIMKVDDVRPGMRGVGYTVFQGTKPETMGVEVLGVLRNLNGPKSDVVLVRLTGEKAEFTGVVAGMSGSPVYIDGKLLGAIAYRIGQFSKEPIAGITPIGQMLEINEFDQSVPQGGGTSVARATAASKTSTPGVQDSNPIQSYAQYLQPIDAPFVFNGFNEAAIKQFAPQLSAMGITPVMGVGSASKEKQPEPLVPGSGRKRNPGPRRHGRCRNLHRYLHGQRPPAGLRPSADAVRYGRHADDQSECGGDACFSAERLQDH